MTTSRTLALPFFLASIGCTQSSATSTETSESSSGNVSSSSAASGDDAIGSSSIAGSESSATTAADGASTGEGPTGSDPFAPQPDESEGLVNVSADLDALLEHGALADACDRYFGGETDRKTMLLCGKWQYFYEPFGTFGVPSVLVTFMAQNFPDELGLAYAELGLVPDPGSSEGLPLGMAPTTKIGGTVDAHAFTCASCHFGQLPDGRYAVGAPNHRYDYGGHILALTLAPTVGLGLSQPSAHDAAAIAKVQPVIDRLNADGVLKSQLLLALLPIASVGTPMMTTAIENAYATWPTGALDFLIAPLPVDDEVHTVSKIIGLWGIPRPEEVEASGMSDALLAWTGDARSLDEFVRGFATLGGTAPPTDEQMRPLLEYIYSLRAPENPTPPDAALVDRGAELFDSAGCLDCHDGPRGSGKRAFTFDEIGTDPAMARWADPELSGDACCGIDVDPGQLTHGVKSPRLVGMWALGRFLHNGSLASLDELLCAAERPPVGSEPMRSDGHAFGCDLADDDKQALAAFLLSH